MLHQHTTGVIPVLQCLEGRRVLQQKKKKMYITFDFDLIWYLGFLLFPQLIANAAKGGERIT